MTPNVTWDAMKIDPIYRRDGVYLISSVAHIIGADMWKLKIPGKWRKVLSLHKQTDDTEVKLWSSSWVISNSFYYWSKLCCIVILTASVLLSTGKFQYKKVNVALQCISIRILQTVFLQLLNIWLLFIFSNITSQVEFLTSSVKFFGNLHWPS